MRERGTTKRDAEVDEAGEHGRNRDDEPREVDLLDEIRRADEAARRTGSGPGRRRSTEAGREGEDRVREAVGADAGELAEEDREDDHRHQRLEDRPRDSEGRLLVPDLDVAPDEEVEQLPVLPDIPEAGAKSTPGWARSAPSDVSACRRPRGVELIARLLAPRRAERAVAEARAPSRARSSRATGRAPRQSRPSARTRDSLRTRARSASEWRTSPGRGGSWHRLGPAADGLAHRIEPARCTVRPRAPGRRCRPGRRPTRARRPPGGSPGRRPTTNVKSRLCSPSPKMTGGLALEGTP